MDGREESKDTKPGKFAGISAEDGKWKTELPKEKYTRNAGGRSSERLPPFYSIPFSVTCSTQAQ